ncbi:MAG: single-stranded-DNA-specific exonuclease RecJ [Planctomycetaceae bacterium]|nr:single-stranded-DNA-specific exonuclease RecJ [Planctomycetaceae bacterium]MBT6155128.1 single-stranded-DNA-specific exonuclease RecJ [Planctomycetaceae bacterium]MBT6483356.1 single-stranded-DNA-specific exonuclease RecJ [Planctomycetaceae bacterium]MBT6493848.1 single-stranded-DNA-specific exonuclease RecJ [Planctomycetaceae bacterium]
MARTWRFLPHDESRVRGLSGTLNVAPLTAQVLIARGYESAEQALTFLNTRLTDLHEPDELPGAAEAADRIVAAVKADRRITIYGDYDVDGMTSTSILWHCLKLAGATVEYYIPSRLDEGYGLNCDAIRRFHEEDPEQIVISVDCGIASLEEAALARELGLELIVTDHHTFATTSVEEKTNGAPAEIALPDAACLVHPRLPGSNYPFGELCGAGVAFKVAWAICKRFGDGKKATPRMREFLKAAVSLAAIGTVADMVPLVDENRVIVRYGLSSLLENANPGLKALLTVAGIEKNKQLDADDVGFAIAPRLNAAGRLGQARLAVELLTTENPERAVQLAQYLDELNKNRRTVERRIFKQAKELVEENPDWQNREALVLAHPDWHAGVIGIVANRIAEHFKQPAILMTIDRETNIGQGSGRSFAGFDLHAGLTACVEHLITFGGHQAAAGVKMHVDNIDAFRDTFCEFVAENHEVTERDLELRIDAEVRLADCTQRGVTELDRLGPFGQENPRPVFAATRVELAEPPRTMGEGDRHLSLRVRHYGTVLRAVAFGRGEWAEQIEAADGPISISFAASINEFRGRRNVELRLIDWQPETATATVPPASNDTST